MSWFMCGRFSLDWGGVLVEASVPASSVEHMPGTTGAMGEWHTAGLIGLWP